MKTFFCTMALLYLILFKLEAQSKSDFTQINRETESGNYFLALKAAKEMLKTDSLNTRLWHETGKLHQLMQQYNLSVSCFEQALKIDTTNTKALLALAKTNKLAGKINTSIQYYEQLLEKEPNNMAALSNLAVIYKANFKISKAFRLYERLHHQDTLNAEYVRKMANCKISMGELPEAYKLLKKAYQINSKNLLVVYDLTKIYVNAKKYDTAISIINKTIERYPVEGKLYARRGDAHFGKNHHYRSVPDYRKAIELEYKSYRVIKRLGTSLFSIKKYVEAKDILEQLIVKDTIDYKVCVYLGNIYNELGVADKGILFFNRAIDILTPGPLLMSSIYAGKATSYHLKEQYYKQIEMIQNQRKVLSGKYGSYQYLLEIADIYENGIKDKRKAIKFYEKYWKQIKTINWYPEKDKNAILSKINHLKEDLHFEK